LVTVSSNLTSHEHYKGIAIQTLPKTFRDTFSVVRHLGIPLLWIDAFCIVQDDPDDITEQLSRMRFYYQNARVTIAISTAADVTEGFLKFPSSKLPKPIELFNLAIRLPPKCQIPYYNRDGRDGTLTVELKTKAHILRMRIWKKSSESRLIRERGLYRKNGFLLGCSRFRPSVASSFNAIKKNDVREIIA
jgi:Heterokaryon incompatibility protein (HET)